MCYDRRRVVNSTAFPNQFEGVYIVVRKRRRQRTNHLDVPIVPPLVIRDEAACRAMIVSLRKGLRIAEAALRRMTSAPREC